MGTHGNARAIFRRAIDRGNLLVADATAREMGQITLEEALDLLALMGRFGDKRFDRAAVRWLQRLLDERTLSLVDVQVVVANVAALASARRASAVDALRAFVR